MRLTDRQYNLCAAFVFAVALGWALLQAFREEPQLLLPLDQGVSPQSWDVLTEARRITEDAAGD